MEEPCYVSVSTASIADWSDFSFCLLLMLIFFDFVQNAFTVRVWSVWEIFSLPWISQAND